MYPIDYSSFLPGTPAVNPGRKLLLDTFQQIAEARERKRQFDEENERMRRANDLTFQSSMYGHNITAAHNEATERGAAEQRTEANRHNLATEGTAAAAVDQRKQEALTKLMADPKFQEARQSGDPAAFAPWGDVLTASGLTVQDVMSTTQVPGEPTETPAQGPMGVQPPPLTPEQAEGAPIPPPDEGVDAISGPAARMPTAGPSQPTGAKQITGPGGLSFTFDPKMNAEVAIAKGRRAAQGMEQVAGQTGDTFVADATRDIAPLVQAYVATGMDPKTAMDKATAAVTARAGQASARRNADVSAANAGKRQGLGEERLDLSKGTYAWDKAGKVLSQLGAKELVLQDRKYADMLASLTANPNAALDAAAAGQWVKLAQGGTGVISDSDMETFWHKIGGVGTKVEGKIQELINGQISAGKRQVVTEAMQWLAGRARTNLVGVKASLRTALESDPNVTPEMRTAILRTYGASPSKAEALIDALAKKHGVQ